MDGQPESADRILLQRADGVATVVLNNPARRNALSKAMWRDLGDTFTALAEDSSVRCVVIRGAGDKAFAAGADISRFREERSTLNLVRDYDAMVDHAQDAIRHCPHPVVAMIMGACVGGGCGIALACDIRIAGESAKFGITARNLGIFYPYHDIAELERLVGPAVAMEIMIEGRIMSGREACEKGLVNRVIVDERVEAEAMEAAARIAEGAPLSARFHKKAIRRAADPRPLTDSEREEVYRFAETEDYWTGVEAFLNKKPARFSGR
ncbi:MAG: enoyl-CoA hydratase-related protein [Acetobacterales bacterium]